MTPVTVTPVTHRSQAVGLCLGVSHPEIAADQLDADYYLRERYLGVPRRSRLITAYYAAKPMLPRAVQLRMRQRYARLQMARDFPAWPIEPVLVDAMYERIRAALNAERVEKLPTIGFWPDGYQSACVLTHDVEGPFGVENIAPVLELEQRYGLVSSWNFVAEDYAIPTETFDVLRTAGCEIGVHGINHDGKLFQSQARFKSDLPKIHSYLARWGAVGFRSPATHRRADWMPELGCLYDSSYPDTDPFQPQPGGCCSILPFMLGDLVELPITLVQDHTLWEILMCTTAHLWMQKSEWIHENHGLVNIITHPDYFTTPRRFEMYEEFLAHLCGQPTRWHALPRDVAAWWKARAQMTMSASGAHPRMSGDCGGHARIWWAQATGGKVKFDV